MVRVSLLLLLTTALCLAACDSSQPDEPLVAEPGRFSATVAFDGGNRRAFSGLASASTVQLFVFDSLFTVGDSLLTTDSLQAAFTISLGETGPAGPGQLISFLRTGERPAPGTYPLGGFDRTGFSGFFATFDGAAPPIGADVFAAEAGTLTVEVSTDERAAGRFEFRARSFLPGQGAGRSVTVRGTFDADIRDFGGVFPRGE